MAQVWHLRAGGDVGTTWTPSSATYFDVELCFDAEPGQVALARSVAAEIAQHETFDVAYVEKVRLVVGTVVSALVLLAAEHTQVHCLFRVLERQIRVHVSVRGQATPSPEAKAQHSRLLDQLLVSASTITVPDGAGGCTVVTDALVPVTE